MLFIYMNTKKKDRNKNGHFTKQECWVLSDLRLDWKPTQNEKLYKAQTR